MSIYQSLLCASGSAISDITQESMNSVISWNGRKALKIVRNTLCCTSLFGVAYSVYNFSTPLVQTTFPNWGIGTVTGGVALLICAGSICLCASSPPAFEELVRNLAISTRRLENENQQLRENITSLQQEVDRLSTLTEATYVQYERLENDLDATVIDMGSAVKDLADTEKKMSEAASTTAQTNASISGQVDRLEILLTSHKAAKRSMGDTPVHTVDPALEDFRKFLESDPDSDSMSS